MKPIIFKDETGDTIRVELSFTKEYVVMHDGGNDFWIGVESIDKLIETLHLVKKELNLD